MQRITPEIKNMISKIEPYRLNALELKPDTPKEIVEMDKVVKAFFSSDTPGIQ